MTVIIITDVLAEMGGAERNLYLLSKGLIERGHKVVICCLKCGEISRQMQDEGFNVRELNIKRIYDVKGIISFVKLRKFVKREKASIIISYHNASDYLGFILSFLTRIPIVSSRRDMGFNLKKRDILAYRFINSYFTRIITVSKSVKKYIEETQKVKSSKVTVIYNGVEPLSHRGNGKDFLNIFNKAEFNRKHINICCLASIKPIKGQQYLIEAAALISKHYTNVRFYIVGECANDNYYSKLNDQIKILNLKNIVKFTGKISHSKVQDLWNLMDIAVLPSLSEGMSNALLEAMIAEKPVIATAVGGNPEIVEDGITGYIVPPEDPKAIFNALECLLKKPELCRNMGLKGCEIAKTKFSLTNMVESYENLLMQIILNKRFK